MLTGSKRMKLVKFKEAAYTIRSFLNGQRSAI